MTSGSAAVLAWLWLLPQPAPSARRINTAIAIAQAADETECPRYWAAVLDVWVEGESNYSDDPTIAGGCTGTPIGTPCPRAFARYCSPWMVQCGLVPANASLLDEARIVIALFRESARECSAWPFSLYSGFGCRQAGLVDARVLSVVRELAFSGGSR